MLQPEALAAVLVAREVTETSTDHVAETEHIRTALRELPSAQATAVVLATFYGLTAQQIAERCDVPLGTAKSRIRLVLARLRDNLKVTDG